MTKSGMPDSNRKVKGTIHWVSVSHSLDAEVRLYDRLFMVEDPASEKEKDFRELLNPDSLIVKKGCKVEEYLKDAKPLDSFQFQRIGYFNVDRDSTEDTLVFNRTVALKDSWKK
jgi:glutaminyl-tRNA synthetase